MNWLECLSDRRFEVLFPAQASVDDVSFRVENHDIRRGGGIVRVGGLPVGVKKDVVFDAVFRDVGFDPRRRLVHGNGNAHEFDFAGVLLLRGEQGGLELSAVGAPCRPELHQNGTLPDITAEVGGLSVEGLNGRRWGAGTNFDA